MPNYLFSYDLNGSHPTHAEMDQHIKDSGWSVGRILETVWYIGTTQILTDVEEYVTSILSDNDPYIVADCHTAAFDNLLVTEESFLEAWRAFD